MLIRICATKELFLFKNKKLPQIHRFCLLNQKICESVAYFSCKFQTEYIIL